MTQEEADSIRAGQEALPQVPVPLGNAGTLPKQAYGVRPSRALPYRLRVTSTVEQNPAQLRLRFYNDGSAGAVFHVYDRLNLDAVPRRYAVEPNRTLDDVWSVTPDALGRYDLWLIGPNGFHRHFQGSIAAPGGNGPMPEVTADSEFAGEVLRLTLRNTGAAPCSFTITANAYTHGNPWRLLVPAGGERSKSFPLLRSGRWYDFTVGSEDAYGFSRRFAGRIENGRHSVTDPAMGRG
jgi:phospholipase C